ncbi:MAG: adenylate/guanylate cyclase domain-containing protein [Spirochaetales bacterium]|nr:adenylate/guanylate cyclase domain-containing protein [Spirochaetales bacterium]
MEELDRKQWFQDEIARITSKSSNFINKIKSVIIILCVTPFFFKIPLGTFTIADMAVIQILGFLLIFSYIMAGIVERNIKFREISEILNAFLGSSGILACQYFMYVFQNEHPENLFFSWVVLISIVICVLISMRYSTALTTAIVVITIVQYAILYFYTLNVIPAETKEIFPDINVATILQRLVYLALAGGLIILFTRYVNHAMYRISDAAIELNSMKDTFGQYVSQDILEYVLEHSKKSTVSERYGVVLFSDIRNFTTLMEANTSKETVAKLNEYFAQMASIIERNGGYINKFIGDAILAVFSDINLNEESNLSKQEARRIYSQRALKAAKEMSAALKKMNKKWQKGNEQEISIGIGLHAGNIILGNVGSENRMEFACLGKTIIDTMDVEDLTKKYGQEIIVSRAITANKDYKLTLLMDDPKVFEQPLYYVEMEENA